MHPSTQANTAPAYAAPIPSGVPGVSTIAGSTIAGSPLTKDWAPLLTEQTDAVQNAAARVTSLTVHVRSIADNIFGHPPLTPETTTVAQLPESPARADAIQRATGRLHEALYALEHELSRLNAL